MNYTHLTLVATFFLLGCDGPSDTSLKTVPSEAEVAEIVYEKNANNIGLVYIGMTGIQIEALDLLYTKTVKHNEDGELTVYLVTLSDNTRLVCTLGLDERVYMIETSSQTVKDRFGNGAGSALQSLQEAYPNGRFIYGSAEGRYAAYITGSPLRFRFDYRDLPESCFETDGECNVSKNIRVKKFEIR